MITIILETELVNKNGMLKMIKYIKRHTEYLGTQRDLKFQVLIMREEFLENLTCTGHIMKANENRVTK